MYVKTVSDFCCIQETHVNFKNRHIRENCWGKIFQANELKKQVGVVILMSNKIDFQQKLIIKGWRRILIKRKITNYDKVGLILEIQGWFNI